jgi:hypothetical protein
MEIWTAVRTVLKSSPAIRHKDLIPKLIQLTGKAKSTIDENLTSLELQGKIWRESGKYYLEKPRSTGKISSTRSIQEIQAACQSDLEKAKSIQLTRSFQALAGYNEPVYFRRLPDRSRK